MKELENSDEICIYFHKDIEEYHVNQFLKHSKIDSYSILISDNIKDDIRTITFRNIKDDKE